MSIRTNITLLISMMVNAVIFGAGAIAVLSIPTLRANAQIWLPAVIVFSLLMAPIVSWVLAPRLRARWSRRQAASRTT